MTFKELVNLDKKTDVSYSQITELRMYLEANKTLLYDHDMVSKNEPLDYCFDVFEGDFHIKSYRDYNETCNRISFYYVYSGNVIITINDDMEIVTWSDVTTKLISDYFKCIDRKKKIDELI